MPLLLVVLIVLTAFAANSVLTRIALADALIGPTGFMVIRLLSGAVMLVVLNRVQGNAGLAGAMRDWRPAAALLVYMVGFSFAYVSMDAGMGALVLFGGVQITMFAGALWLGERPSWRRWVGSALGLVGLAVLMLPGAGAPALLPFGLMSLAAIGWGVFSLLGRGAGAPLGRTAAAFVLACVPVLPLPFLVPDGVAVTGAGIVLAVAAGALTSGLGYALWYGVLPRLDATLAAIAQLTVPILALGGGALFLGEGLTLRFAIAAALILGGVLLAVLRRVR